MYSFDLILLQEKLKADKNQIKKLLVDSPQDQFLRRTFIRTIFAEIEANCFFLKRILLLCNESELIKLTSGELSVLLDKKYSLKDNGKIQESNNILRTLPNIKFTITTFDKKFLPKQNAVSIDWGCLEKSVKIRNRIVHPKLLNDIDIKEDDMNILVSTYNSFSETITKLLDKIKSLTAMDTKYNHVFDIIRFK